MIIRRLPTRQSMAALRCGLGMVWLTLSSFGLHAQSADVSPEGEDGPKTVFTHRFEAGLSLHTRGMGGILQRGKYRGVGKVNTWTLEMFSMKHAKEVRLSLIHI